MRDDTLDERNRRAFLEAEAAALALIVASLEEADTRTERALRKHPQDARARSEVHHEAVRLEHELTTAIEQARADARLRATHQHEAEAAAAALLLLIGRTKLLPAERHDRADEAAARSASKGLSQPWLLVWQRHMQSRADARRSVREQEAARRQQASAAIAETKQHPYRSTGSSEAAPADVLVGRARRTAATEAADAYNDQRIVLVAQEQVRSPELGQLLVWQWDATLDAKTCPRCAALNGQTWMLYEAIPFRPPVHPFCRCLLTLKSAASIGRQPRRSS